MRTTDKRERQHEDARQYSCFTERERTGGACSMLVGKERERRHHPSHKDQFDALQTAHSPCQRVDSDPLTKHFWATSSVPGPGRDQVSLADLPKKHMNVTTWGTAMTTSVM